MIARTDRVSTVIGRDESLIDVFVALSPAFERLRRASMRKVMARLVTVEQAARMAGVDADELVARLNEHAPCNAGRSHASDLTSEMRKPGAADMTSHTTEDAKVMPTAGGARPATKEDTKMPTAAGPRPEILERVAPDDVVELDVRAELRGGREPFSLIMAALRTVPPGGVLCVRAIFEPVPLYAVMKRQGLEHWTEQLADDDWRVWFHPPLADAAAGAPKSAPSAEAEPRAAAPAAAPDPEGNVVILDVRDLEPPEPMMRTLAALEQLPAGATLVQINVRVPQFLLPMLEERGFTFDVREQEPDLVRVFIRRST